METTQCNTFITKFNLTNRYVYIKFHWAPNSVDLFQAEVYDKESVWSGSFSNECAKQNCEKVHEELEEVYCSNTLKALRGTSPEFIYDFPLVTNDSNTSVFSWQRKVKIGIQLYGSISVTRCMGSKDSIIDLLLLQNSQLSSKIENYKINTNQLNDNLNRYQRELEKFADIKIAVEANLYGKFVQVLNDKKKRIQLLEKQLQKTNC